MIIRSALVLILAIATASAQSPSITDYPTPQEAVNAHPGVRLYVPPGVHRIDAALTFGGEGGGLYGPGTLEQTNPGSSIITIENGVMTRIEGVTPGALTALLAHVRRRAA